MIRTTTTVVLALAGTALAQYEITIDVENPVLMPGESTVVTLKAGFDPALYAMAGIGTGLVVSTGTVGLGDAAVVEPMDGPGHSAGSPSSTGYDGIIAGQIHSASAGLYADPTNPIAFWEVTYTAPLDVAVSFDVDLSTRTRRYDVYVQRTSSFSESHLIELVEGSATIHVIPAPASASLLALGLLAAARRRR
ncbi:MAG: hypothetical protein NCW75_13230 [Phycisphaera sp.]|nr:MAG: hypothetical protein NCW75_13230 [Phycisphaera sp.]